ncbi:hypothetical protein BDW69DRAFT_175491 [Aspergillus filifer]
MAASLVSPPVSPHPDYDPLPAGCSCRPHRVPHPNTPALFNVRCRCQCCLRAAPVLPLLAVPASWVLLPSMTFANSSKVISAAWIWTLTTIISMMTPRTVYTVILLASVCCLTVVLALGVKSLRGSTVHG